MPAEGDLVTRWYVSGIALFILAVAAWSSMGGTIAAAATPLLFAETAAESADPTPSGSDSSGRSVVEIVGLIVLLVVPVALIVVLARLQRRRHQAFKEAAKRHKEEERVPGGGQRSR